MTQGENAELHVSIEHRSRRYAAAVAGSLCGRGARIDSATRRGSLLFTVLSALLCASVLGLGLVTPSVAGASQGEAIVSAAASQVGVPYCWDGGEPTVGPTHGDGDFHGEAPDCTNSATRGFDCSGLALWAVYQATAGGVDLPHSASLQASEYATYGGELITSESSLEPGDLIFFGDPGGLSNATHVGIYAGGGEMWDANTAWGRYGDGVYERSISETEHDPHDQFLGGVRYWHESSGPPSEGSFVQVSGSPEVFRIAGGAPIYVNGWTSFGGQQPVDTISQQQFDSLRQYPADGTAVYAAGTGAAYVFAGGAPLYVASWSSVGNPSPIAVDGLSLEHYSASGPLSHVRQYPADGTAVWNGAPGCEHGAGYVFAGGAPLYVASWSSVGNPSPTEIDGYALEHYAAGPLSHVLQYPADGTAVWNGAPGSEHGAGYVFAGGAPLYVSSWEHVGDPSTTEVDGYALEHYGSGSLSHVRQYPADGTFVQSAPDGRAYRIAGGAPFYVHSWSVYGGQQLFVTIDEWDLNNITSPAVHLNATPANGTVVEGLPSETYWSFSSGLRSPIAAISGATTVDDVGLAAYPQLTSPVAGNAGSQVPTNAGGNSAGNQDSSPQPSHGVQGTKTSRPARSTSALSRALAKCRKVKSHRKRTQCITTAKKRYGRQQSRLPSRSKARR